MKKLGHILDPSVSLVSFYVNVGIYSNKPYDHKNLEFKILISMM